MSGELTKEEFGAALYEAIRVCAETQQVLSLISANVHRRRGTTALSEEYGRLKAQAKLAVQHPLITDEDAARLLRKYPWLGT